MLSICLLLLFILGLTACGPDGGFGNAGASNTPASTTVSTTAEATLIKEMTLVGTPTAKLAAGTTFEVDGQIKNGDAQQHDIWLSATLFDATGKVIVTSAPLNVDDTPGGATVPFAIQGTTPQPTWSRFQVTVVKVTENVYGTGTD